MRIDYAAIYAQAVVGGNLEAPHVEGVSQSRMAGVYVVKQCEEFLRMWNDEHPDYIVDRKKLRKICIVLAILKMPKGFRAGCTLYESLAGFQWLIITALLCCVHRKDSNKRRYEFALLEICRKNGKTFIVAVLFLLLFVTEPPFSRFFSVAPDGDLAREIKTALEPLISVNEEVLENDLNVRRDYIRSKRSKTEYRPLNYSNNRMDGKEPNVFIADEIGALPSNYAIEAMKSGQLLVNNRLGFCISTKYPTADNPLEEEVSYAKKVLDDIVSNDAYFALLYEPDDPKPWADDDAVLCQGNPLALEVESVWKKLKQDKQRAILEEKLRENFLTKHCNIVYQGVGTETYIPIDAVMKCADESIDFRGHDLYVGVDLAMTNDNCAVAVAFEEDGEIYADVVGFFPADRMIEKSKVEKADYLTWVNNGCCIPCGDMTVDYKVIEDFVLAIEDKYGANVVSIGYDRYNALSSAQKFETAGYTTVEIKQHSSVLHPPTKLISEKVESGKFHYKPNAMLEANFQNAKCTYDTNLNRYVTKKKSKGKVDMVVALINATYLLQQDVLFGDDWIVQY